MRASSSSASRSPTCRTSSIPTRRCSRKTGFLAPSLLQSDAIGFGVTTPFFWNLAPNYDVTFSPTLLSRQGLLMQGAMAAPAAQRLRTAIRAAGIFQQDPDAFVDDGESLSGDREFRGSVRTVGAFDHQSTTGSSAGSSTPRPTGTFNRDYSIPGADSQGPPLDGLPDRA